jgi:L-malate glycosyltransferase
MLTVLLATRNRAQILSDVLEAYCHLQSPASGWKLVIADNGSTDQTAQVIASFANRLPLHFVCEPKLGKNLALNVGLGLVEGDLIVFTDDDAFPGPDWLVQLRRAADNQPSYSIFGGVVVPRWEIPPPRWIGWVDQGAAYTITDPSLTEGPIDAHHVFGPNMAIRTSVFSPETRFDPSIGPRGPSYPMGSETELVLRLHRQGHKAWHVQGAAVEHFIREEQLNEDWLLQRAIRFGRGQYRLLPLKEFQNLRLWMGVPSYLYRKLFKQAALIAVAKMSFRPEALFRARWRFNFFRGQVIESRKMSRERRALAKSNYSLTPTKEALRRHD